jgi:hypothetical protein
MTKIKRNIFAVPFVVAALSLSSVVPVAAQQQEGLVNVNVTDVGVVVQVPIGIAANVCGVNAAVLAEQLPGDVECDADAQSAADSRQLMRLAEEQGLADDIQAAVGG